MKVRPLPVINFFTVLHQGDADFLVQGVLAAIEEGNEPTILDLSLQSMGKLTVDGILRVWEVIPPTVTHLNLSNNDLEELGAAGLAQALRTIPATVTHLYLTNSRLRQLEAGGLAEVLRSIPATVTHLYLNSSLEMLGAAGLAEALRAIPATVTHLDLSSNSLALLRELFLAKALRAIPATVTHLNLSDNSLALFLGADGLAQVLRAVPAALTRLNLSNNSLEKLGEASLAQVLRATIPAIEVECDNLRVVLDHNLVPNLLSQVERATLEGDYTFSNVTLPAAYESKEAGEELITRLRSYAIPTASLTAALLLSSRIQGLHPDVDVSDMIDLFLDCLLEPKIFCIVQKVLSLLHQEWIYGRDRGLLIPEQLQFLDYFTKVCATLDLNPFSLESNIFKSNTWQDVEVFPLPKEKEKENLRDTSYFIPGFQSYISGEWRSQRAFSECVEFLIKNGFKEGGFKEINTLYNQAGHTALTLAVSQHNYDMCRKLVTFANADINAVNKYGNTPLHIALYDYIDSPDSRKIITWLYTSGASMDIKNCEGKKALDVAKDMNGLHVLPRPTLCR